ncbi:helix-turn-helix domain-containing protein [Bradyrhizobium sp. CCGUVB4N]|uniref:helix-turn-helix domain-containing protein n=1 Tax=Bradyrhizobium sp. CCGUVB4N TaxID=2949631 RepID=UPI0020B237AD|nr:helix-turn-helix domain-containing protein [Bradyrhizobium sp. CCGUVB4N]MCP3386398.1 helix-turn-helix domain-containing protein [Bradyrhizobium sp. CCGUVB4N]
MSAVALETWHRFDIGHVDDLRNAVFDAGLEAIQMPGARVRGSLAFAARDGIVFSSGLIHGNAAIAGPLSRDAITVGIGFTIGAGSLLWLKPVISGDAMVVLPGDECDALLRGTSLYVTATLTAKQLKIEVEREGLVLHRSLTSRTGLHTRPIQNDALIALRKQTESIHAPSSARYRKLGIGRRMLRALVCHYARLPAHGDGRARHIGQAKIIHEAREYIRQHLTSAISVDDLSTATQTSPRSLYRAFSDVLGDTPRDYVRRLRLHRIRRELLSSDTMTVSLAAQNWGMAGDLGRLSKNYRDLFGEYPSSTLALARALQCDDTSV